jgi:NADH-quinone oxidoreductase subunit M
MILALLLLIPFVGGLIAFALSKKSSEWARAFGCLILAANLFLTLLAWRQGRFSDLEANWMLEFERPWIPALGASFHLAMDGISFALVLLANAISLFAVISVSEASRRREGLFFLLLLSTVTGVIGILLATDLLLFFVFWEVMLVPLYFLILVFGEEQRHKAATRFLILTQTSGLFLLLSIVTLYYFTYTATGQATFSYDALIGFRLPPNAERFVAIGFLLAFLVKLPAIPFHFWMPSVFANAPISALMTGLLIKTGAYGLMRFFVPLFPFASEAWAPYLMFLGIATLYYGAVVAYSQSDIKKILAYATISHVGLMLAGIMSQNALAMSGVSVLLITQALSTGGLLIIANHVYSYTHSREISHFSGLYKVMPRAGIIALIFVMASVALPGLGNFVGEWLVLLGLFQRDPLLGIVAAIGIVLSAAYMLRFLHLIFFGPVKEGQADYRDLSPKSLFSCTLLICILLWMGLYPAPLLDVVSPTWQEEGESGPVIESGIGS